MPTWNELFKEAEYRWQDPHSSVVELVGRLSDRPGREILDLGCGAGRHLVYLGSQGFKVYGMDLSENGLLHARGWLRAQDLPSRLVKGDMTGLPYEGDRFDALISIHVIFHNPLVKMRDSIAEIRRVLKPGGLALLTFQSTRSYRYKSGVEIEPNTFLPENGGDRGIPHHFSDLEELGRELKTFIVRKIELDERRGEEGDLSSHWVALLQKPEHKHD